MMTMTTTIELPDTDQATWKVHDNSDQHHAHGMCHPFKALTGQSVDSVIVEA